jgi:hypothetical protein
LNKIEEKVFGKRRLELNKVEEKVFGKRRRA